MGKGRGVFAEKYFKKGEVIEECPIIFIAKEELVYLKRTVLRYYYYEWGQKEDCGAIILGYGSLYNHSTDSNAYYEHDEKLNVLRYIALQEISPAEEILVNYNGEPGDDDIPEFIDN